ncbi:hypothetical protein FRC08_000041 [Ceratobasidium sp. 394]|nr:hypothetical protein FRC08_000041 [Ceratobasidium sp. 394]
MALVVTAPIHLMTTEAMQRMVATLQAGLKDFHNRSLSENQKILQSALEKETLLEAQGKQLDSIQELPKLALEHAQAAAEGSKEVLVKAKEANKRTPEWNRMIKEINDGWRVRDDKLTKYLNDSNKGQQKRDDDMNKTIKMMNGML